MPRVNIPNFADVNVGGGEGWLDAGIYTVNIQAAPQVNPPKPGKQFSQIELDMVVTDGPDQQKESPMTGTTNPTGRTVKDWLSLSPKAAWRIKLLLIASGLLDRNDKDSDVARGNWDTEELIGCTFQVELVEGINNKGKPIRDVNYII